MNYIKRAGVYVRVSAVGQETDLQEHELQEYCERRGWSYVVYRDKGQSGAKNGLSFCAALCLRPRLGLSASGLNSDCYFSTFVPEANSLKT